MISIIIPVYNVEKYLDQCLESVINQSYTDFECILVNDGSTDNSGNICDKWAKKDNRIKVFHQDNQGVSVARNFGIDISQGKYIVFIDSDDWVDRNYLETLMGDDDMDLVMTGNYVEEQNCCLGSNLPLCNNIIEFNKLSIEEIAHLLNKHLFYGPWSKRYKSSIITHHAIKFPLKKSYGEDLMFNFTYLKYVNQIKPISKATYHYRRFEKNTLSTVFRHDFWDTNYSQWLYMYDFFEKKNIFLSPISGIMYKRLWGIIYDSLFNMNYQKMNLIKTIQYVKRIVSIDEINKIDFISADFETSKKIKYLILNQHYIILALKLKFRL